MRLRAALPPIVVLALAVGYIGIEFFEGLDASAPGSVSPYVHAGIVALQAVALVFRGRAPVAVFGVVVVLDAALLATSAGELGTGALAVMIATYVVVRAVHGGTGRARYSVVAAGGLVTATVSAIAMSVAANFAPLAIVATVIARPLLQNVVPAAVAEYVLARERLLQALRDRAELAERERVREVDREIAGVRTAMARELHDIAAHHLSGIIVGAQAASALVATDPDRTREMLRTVQRDARTTLADLRRTVGLLRSDDLDDRDPSGQPAAIPSLSRIAELVSTAQGRGQIVALSVVGKPQVLGPLAETAGYRMVQESLANAARHASGSRCRVRVENLDDVVRITVENDAASSQSRAVVAPQPGRTYGISGMHERVELVGGRLTTGAIAGGGWRNSLDIPLENNVETTRSDS